MGRCSCAEKIGRAGGFLVDAGGHAAKIDHDKYFPPPVRVEVHARRYTNGTKCAHLIRAKEVPSPCCLESVFFWAICVCNKGRHGRGIIVGPDPTISILY